jgi:trigger factor
VSKELEHLAKMRSTPLEVARPAQEGDTVTIDFSVSLNGQVIEGGESKNHPVELGKGQFVPGFEEKLKGISAGDEREFDLKFPDDYGHEELKGKETKVRVKAHSVQKMVVPEINDDFAKKLGQFENLDALKKTLRENMEHEQAHKEKERLRGELIEKLAEASEFGPLPESLIEGEIDRRIGEFAQMLSWQKKTMEDYLAQQKKTMEQMRSDMREGAEKSVRMSLALREFVKQEKIEVVEEDVKNAVTAYLAKYNKVEQAQAEIDEEELTTQMAANLRNEKGMERLEEKVQITEANIKIKE